MRALLAFAFLVALVGSASSQPTVGVEPDDPAMRSAIERARATVARAVAELDAGNSEVSVKLPVRDRGQVEHFWLSEVRYDKRTRTFHGKIDNDPQTVRTVRFGQEVSVHESAISDWLYMRSGRMHGNYTVRVLLRDMPADEASRIRAVLADDA